MEWRCSFSNVAGCQLMSQFGEKLGGKKESAVLALLSIRARIVFALISDGTAAWPEAVANET
jgi:hypothetical protein